MKFFKKPHVRQFRISAILLLLVGTRLVAYSQKNIAGNIDPGKKLPLVYNCGEGVSQTFSKSALAANGDLIVGVCDKIFRVNVKNKIVWQQPIGQIGDLIYLPAANRVYVANNGSTIYTFDAANGKRLDVFAQNGNAVFKNFKPFGSGFLYVSSAEDYRARVPDMADELSYLSIGGSGWTIQIPPNSEIVVQGQRIFAVTTTAAGVFSKELKIPQKK